MIIKEENYYDNSRKTVLALGNYYLEKAGVPMTKEEEDFYTNGVLNIPVSLVAEESNIVIGRIFGNIDTVNQSIRIDGLYVDSKIRGKGIGKALVQKYEEIAKENNCKICFVDTTSSSAPEFYEKLGFTRIAEINDYPFEGETYYLYIKRFDL